ncbi:MAG: type II secretion system F family protein [Planctomycetota bacterium]|jgi:type II secretory pathway component PulF
MSQLSFHYQAIDRDGARAKGVVDAADRNDAFRQLTAAGLRPVRLRSRSARRKGRRKKITLKDLSHLTYQLSVLLHARIPVVDGLRSVVDQEPNERLRRVIEDVASRISAGSSVTEAMDSYRDLFGDVYVETVRAAEATGNMVQVLSKLAEMLERRYEMNKAVKGAMMYPACVIGVLILAVSILLIFVVPTFAEMFAERGIELPVPTQILVAFSGFVQSWWYLILGTFVMIALAIRHAWSTPGGRRRIDNGLHRVPVVREMLRGFAVSRFANVFGLTLGSGLSLLDALEIAGRVSGRPLLQADTQKMQDQVKHGGRLSDVMMRCSYLPGFAKRLFVAGEEAAELTRMCDIVARHYDREVKYLTKNLTTVIEPIMIVGLAGIVCILALAIFLPMWNMTTLIG